MILKTMQKHEVYLTDKQADQVKKMLADGQLYVLLPDGSFIRSSTVAEIVPDGKPTRLYKPFEELKLPDIEVPDEMKEAYDKRTISLEDRKRLDSGE